MQNIPSGRLARNLLIAGVAVLVIAAGAVVLSRGARESLACKESTDVQFSPGGKYRAQMTEKACGGAFGQASDLVELKVEMQDKPGWFIEVPLEYNGYANPAASAVAPAIKWKNANALEVTVYSNELTGTLVRRIDSLTVTRRYLQAPGKKAPGHKAHGKKAGKPA